MKAVIDLKGQRFGRLIVIMFAGRINKITRWQCKCDCGKLVTVQSQHLRKGETKSCGCLAREMKSINHTIHGMAADRKTKRNKRLYAIWSGMKQRCTNPNIRCYKNYGGRGISVCKEWLDFIPFKNWALANGYRDDLTIDRINVDGNYCPDNCRWATWKEQANNKQKSRRAA